MPKSYTGESPQCKPDAEASRKKNISRRKLSANFTTMPNELFDHGLSLEAVGLLAYLITRSHDWRVIPNQLRDKFRCGRNKIYQLLSELIAAGFIRRSKSRDGSIRYTVFDQPTNPNPQNGDQAIGDPFPQNGDQAPFPQKPDPQNGDALPNTERYQRRTEKKEAPKTERARAREPLPEKPEQANLFEAETTRPMNGHRQEAKEGRGLAGKKVACKGHPLPADWAPSQSDEVYGEQLGFTRAEIQGMAETMRLWAGANAHRPITRKCDWHLTFMGWMRREREKPRGGSRPHEKGYAGLLVELGGGEDLVRTYDEVWGDGAYARDHGGNGHAVNDDHVMIDITPCRNGGRPQ
jgi:hypothetical protein